MANNLRGVRGDEFYTLYEDVECELDNYDFTGMKIVCPCDGEHSAFVQYCTNKGYDFDYFEGDYESVDYDKYDVVLTNPPFTNYKKFYNLIKDKLFCIIAPLSVTYKSWFNWNNNTVGYSGRVKKFKRPDGTIEDMSNTVWITNMNHDIKDLPLCNTIEHTRQLDNGNLEVNKKKYIPKYKGIYYVPITIFEHTPLPENIKIIGVDNAPKYQGKKLYTRFIIEVK